MLHASQIGRAAPLEETGERKAAAGRVREDLAAEVGQRYRELVLHAIHGVAKRRQPFVPQLPATA